MRDIVREPDFEDALARLRSDMMQADRFVEGAEWVLAKDPTCGVNLYGNIWAVMMPDIVPITPRTLYYTFDDETVTFLDIV